MSNPDSPPASMPMVGLRRWTETVECTVCGEWWEEFCERCPETGAVTAWPEDCPECWGEPRIVEIRLTCSACDRAWTVTVRRWRYDGGEDEILPGEAGVDRGFDCPDCGEEAKNGQEL